MGIRSTVAARAADSVSYRSPTSMSASGFRHSSCEPMSSPAFAACLYAGPGGIVHRMTSGFRSRYVEERMPQSWRPVVSKQSFMKINLTTPLDSVTLTLTGVNPFLGESRW